MLKSLRRIVQEITNTPDMFEALQAVAQRTNESLETEACNIFLVDDEKSEYVLIATQGYNPKLIGKLRLKLGVGLIGMVGERGEPINLVDAQTHEHFAALPGVDEKNLHGFLGVPILHQRELLGVLTVRHQEIERFDEAEEAFLITLSTQLATAIAHAKSTGAFRTLGKRRTSIKKATFDGTPGAPGVAIGTAVVVYPLADLDAVPERTCTDPKEEVKRFNVALKEVRDEIKRLDENLSANLSAADRELFDAYLHLLDSNSLTRAIRKEIRQGQWAPFAVKKVILAHVAQFEAMEDSYLRERGSDLKDLGQRILAQLQSEEKQQRTYPENTILIGEEVTPTILADVPDDRLRGVVSVTGSSNSHVAILARAMGVPTVMGASGIPVAQFEGIEVILDGYYGQVYASPSREVKKEFKRLQSEEHELDAELETLRELPAETHDGFAVSLYVNTGLAADIGRSLSVGAEGVGLYRTEVPFMMRERFPSEEEQRVLYRQLLQAFAPRPVMMRTLDIGGDKALSYFPVVEDNPFLGWRGIRITLDHPEIFLVQIRAMLRASIDLNNLHIMLPMISNVSEIEEALRLLDQAHQELISEGLNIVMPTVGVMVEVPSAIYQIREFARRVDFLSVGSNDLTQYLLAVDRNNARVASLYDVLHPAVIRALVQAVKGTHKERKHISICGEMAGDPLAVVLLLAMGFDTLSMSATRLPRVKWVIRSFSMEKSKALLNEVLEMDDAVEIRCHLELALDEAGLGGLIRAGR